MYTCVCVHKIIARAGFVLFDSTSVFLRKPFRNRSVSDCVLWTVRLHRHRKLPYGNLGCTSIIEVSFGLRASGSDALHNFRGGAPGMDMPTDMYMCVYVFPITGAFFGVNGITGCLCLGFAFIKGHIPRRSRNCPQCQCQQFNSLALQAPQGINWSLWGFFAGAVN